MVRVLLQLLVKLRLLLLLVLLLKLVRHSCIELLKLVLLRSCTTIAPCIYVSLAAVATTHACVHSHSTIHLTITSVHTSSHGSSHHLRIHLSSILLLLHHHLLHHHLLLLLLHKSRVWISTWLIRVIKSSKIRHKSNKENTLVTIKIIITWASQSELVPAIITIVLVATVVIVGH